VNKIAPIKILPHNCTSLFLVLKRVISKGFFVIVTRRNVLSDENKMQYIIFQSIGWPGLRSVIIKNSKDTAAKTKDPTMIMYEQILVTRF